MSEISARASRRAFCLGSCTRNGFTARSGPVLRCSGAPPPAGAIGAGAGGAAAGGGAAGGAAAGAARGATGGAAAGGGAARGAAGGAATGGADTGRTGAPTGGPTGARGGVAGGAGGVGRRSGGAAAGAIGGGGGGGGTGGVRGVVVVGVKTGAPPPVATPAPTGCGATADAATVKTLLHTAQRARTPPAGTLAGSTRYTVSQDGQDTFTLRPRYCASPGSGSWRRSTTYTEPGCVFA